MTDTPADLPEGCKLLDLDEVDGTNAEAMRRVLAGERGPLWIIAAGNLRPRPLGPRLGLEPGNLFASFVTDARLPAAKAGQLALVAGVAAHRSDLPRGRAFPACASNGRTTFSSVRRRRAAFSLKAPRGRRTPGTVAVIGIGLNLVSSPDDLGRAATFLARHGLSLSPREALCFLAHTMNDWIRIWDGGDGFAQVRAAWLGARRRPRRGAHRQRRRRPSLGHLCRSRRHGCAAAR